MCSISHNSRPVGIGDIGGPAISSQPVISVEGFITLYASVAVHLEGYSLLVISYWDDRVREPFIAMVSPMSMHRDVRICCRCYFFISVVSSY